MNVGSNVLWSLTENFVRMVGMFFLSILIMKTLGPSQYGVLSAAFVTISIASAIGSLGLDLVVVRELSAADYDRGAILGSACFIRCIAVVVVVLTLVIMAFCSDEKVFGNAHGYWSACLLMAILIPFNPFAFSIGASFQAFLRAKLLTISKLTGLIIAAMMRIFGIMGEFSIAYFALCHLVEMLVATAITVWLYKKYVHYLIGRWKVVKGVLLRLIDGAKWLFLSTIMVQVISGGGILLLSALSSDTETGIYSSAMRLVMLAQLLPGIMCKAFLPVITRLHSKKNIKATLDLETQMLKSLWAYGYVACLCYIIFSDLMISMLIGGEFSAASGVLKILAFIIIPVSVGAVRNILFSKTKNYKKIMIADVAAAILTLTLGLWLIPKHGSIGAAYAALIATTMGSFVIPFVILDRSYLKLICSTAITPFPKLIFLMKTRI